MSSAQENDVQNELFLDSIVTVANDRNYQKDSSLTNELVNRMKIYYSNALRKKEKDNDVTLREWSTYSILEKLVFVSITLIKVILFIFILYVFLISLSFMTIGFTMVSSQVTISDTIRFLISSTVGALFIGVFLTAITQNATVTSSIVMSMLATGIIPEVNSALPIIVGANIGTCITYSLIALTMTGDAAEFKRAVTAANLSHSVLTALIVVLIEMAFGGLTSMIANAIFGADSERFNSINAYFGPIVNPITNLFIQLDLEAVNRLAAGDSTITSTALRCCGPVVKYSDVTNNTIISSIEQLPKLTNATVSNISYYEYALASEILKYKNAVCTKECSYWSMPMLRVFGDAGTGLFWIILSIIVLIVSLFSIVQVVNLIVVGPIARVVTRVLNASFPGKFKWFTELLFFIGAVLLNLILQSSNIITATLVPLCGVGMITVHRVYVMIFGSNIGTTITVFLSALTSPSSTLNKSMELALLYLIFNIIGTMLWLPFPFLRIPKFFSRKLGSIASQHRWFLPSNMLAHYYLIPLIIIGLSFVPNYLAFIVIGVPHALISLSLIVILLLRRYYPKILPQKLKSFDWLPLCMHSLKPYDNFFNKMKCFERKTKVERCAQRYTTVAGLVEESVVEKEIEEIPLGLYLIRRLNVIENVVSEARNLSYRSTILAVGNNELILPDSQVQSISVEIK